MPVESSGNQPQAAEVWMFCQVQSFSSAWALVQRLELVDVDASTDSATWTSSSTRQFIDIQQIMSPLVYTILSDQKIRTLLPWYYCHMNKK